MQKGVFTTWIKELCALVFVQTIQAFILAIVLSIILTFLAPNNGIISRTDEVSALGILCVVLLTSLTKMEQITKKIFGLESGILQNKPPHGLAATMLALKAAGRVINNVPKMIGGIGSATLGAGLDKKKAEANKLKRLNQRGFGNAPPITQGGNGGTSEDQGRAESDEELREKRERANQQFDSNAASGNGMGAPSVGNLKSSEYYKIMDKYEDEIAKAKEKRRKGIETALSGAAETIGAGVGGLTGLSIGTISGLATGDLDQIPKAAAYGMGVGDAAGENIAKAVSSAATNIKNRSKVNSNLDKQLRNMEANLKINNEHRGRTATRIKNINKELNNIDKM